MAANRKVHGHFFFLNIILMKYIFGLYARKKQNKQILTKMPIVIVCHNSASGFPSPQDMCSRFYTSPSSSSFSTLLLLQAHYVLLSRSLRGPTVCCSEKTMPAEREVVWRPTLPCWGPFAILPRQPLRQSHMEEAQGEELKKRWDEGCFKGIVWWKIKCTQLSLQNESTRQDMFAVWCFASLVLFPFQHENMFLQCAP